MFQNNKYFKQIEYGNIYFNLVIKVIPTMLWWFFVYKYYYPYYKSCKDCSPLFLVLLLIPNLFIFLEVLLNFKSILSFKPQLISGWTSCTNIFKSNKNKNKNKNILGTYNFNCASLQIESLNDISSELQNKFYYLNTTLFLLLLIFTNLSKISNKKLEKHNIVFIAITLFIGTLGVLPPTYDDSFTWSLIAMMVFGTLLNMNIAAFLVVLYSLF